MHTNSYKETNWNSKPALLFMVLGGFFITNALIAEFIGVKIFSLERTLGFDPVKLSFFGESDLGFNLTTGVLLWPVVFIMTDVINEYFGTKGVKMLSFMTAGLITYAFIMVSLGIIMVPADFWPTAHINPAWTAAEQAEVSMKMGDYNFAFTKIFGQGLWIIVGSLVAFLVGQFADVLVFHRVKKWTGEKAVWLRATGSTLVSQLIDSFVVLFIAFYLGADWGIEQVLAICIVNYMYKVFMAIVLTPLIYLAHFLIDKYLGSELSTALKSAAQLGK
jgi:uncharacterized PurR-regulated membrane protein YhhQ (DUF165 family)